MIDADFGFDIYRGEVSVMKAAHRHQELELNVMFRGSMTYLFGAKTLELRQGQVALFWATTPHRLIRCESDTDCGWLTLPLASFLRYTLPEQLRLPVLQGKAIIETFSDLEGMIFNRWLSNHPKANESIPILELELEAWLRRMAGYEASLDTTRHNAINPKASQLAQFLSEHYQEALSLRHIADSVSLNPSYATTLFKKSFGMTLHNYLNQYRIAHAQRLLISTDMSILDIAFDSGFGSSSQFYAAFTKACSTTPRAYRQALKQKA